VLVLHLRVNGPYTIYGLEQLQGDYTDHSRLS
jgi:hypothetical protein